MKKLLTASLIFALAIFMGASVVEAAVKPVYFKSMAATNASAKNYKKGFSSTLSANYRLGPSTISSINGSVRYNPVSTTINACPPIGAPRPGAMQCGVDTGGFPRYCTGSYEKTDEWGCLFTCQVDGDTYLYNGSQVSWAYQCTEVGAMN